MKVIKQRADEIRVGDIVNGDVVEHIHVYGPMGDESTGYAQFQEIHFAANPGWMTGPSVKQCRGDTILSVWIP